MLSMNPTKPTKPTKPRKPMKPIGAVIMCGFQQEVTQLVYAQPDLEEVRRQLARMLGHGT